MTPELLLPWLAPLWALWLSRRPQASRPLWMRRSLLLLLVLLMLRYLHWRAGDGLNRSSALAAALSLLLLVAEAWLLLSSLLPLLLSWRRFSDGVAAADSAQARWLASSWRPWVDVLIPTCGEPLPVLERCLLGCSQLDYSRRTLWVLDDAGRPEVAELARLHGCRYHHRLERRHAKAGNLNAGLRLGQGELVAVFDADFVPQRHFLERTIGLLQNPAVALVQTPQHFFNADPVMRNLALEAWLLPDEESFYRWIEPVRSAWGAVVCAGTSFLVRRAALEQIGGFVEAAISEDLASGMALAARGWELRYLHEKLSAGLAAETMLDFVRQRQRWAAGTLQTLRLPQGPLRLRGLSLGQRLAYLEGTLHWFDPLPRLVLLLLPLSVGLLGVPPFRFNGEAIASLLLPLWLSLLLSLGWFNQRSRHALAADLPSWAQAVPLAATVLASLAGRFQPFRITPKHRLSTRGGIAAALAAPLLVLLLLHGWNLALIGRVITAGGGEGSEWMGAFWGLITLLGLLLALRACWDPPRPDPNPWLALRLPARLRALSPLGQQIETEVEIAALSETGVQLAGADGLPPGSRPLSLLLNPVAPSATFVPSALAAAAGSTTALPALPLRGERPSPGRLLWDRSDAAALRSLSLWLFTRPGAWPQRQAPPEWRTLLAMLRSLVRPPWATAPELLSLVPQQLAPGRSGAGDRSDRSPVSAS